MKPFLPVLLLVCVGIVLFVAFGPVSNSSTKNQPAKDAPAQAAFDNETLPKLSPEDLEEPIITDEPGTTPAGMVWIPGGQMVMGSDPPSQKNEDKLKRDEVPRHRVIVDGFWMDETEVTNAQFAKFVEETGYVTFAEQVPKREDFLGVVPDINLIPEENLVPGSLIYNKEFDRENFRDDYPNWEYQAWKYQKHANWKQPTGPDSTLDGKDDHPVVNVVYQDCVAYCDWAGKRLATEAEWEYASRGGHADRKYPWGNELIPNGKYQCNYWQGHFPLDHQILDGFEETSPVKSFPANDYGLYDMSGNVWEWVNDYYRIDYYQESPVRNPQGPADWLDPAEPQIEKRVTRGGSFLCNTNNCTGYRCAARMRSDVTSASFHTGFRCVVDPTMRATEPE